MRYFSDVDNRRAPVLCGNEALADESGFSFIVRLNRQAEIGRVAFWAVVAPLSVAQAIAVLNEGSSPAATVAAFRETALLSGSVHFTLLKGLFWNTSIHLL